MTSIARHHAEWLSLVEVSGPFLSMPVLMRTFPQGLDARDPEKTKQMRLALDEWEGNRTDSSIHYAWIRHILMQILGFPNTVLAEGQAIPSGMEAQMPLYGETLRPDIVVINPPGTSNAGRPRLLISILPFDQSLEKPLAGRHWKASSATRMMEMLHSTDVSLGLITNGEHWMLVHAPRGETTGFASWYANLWTEEPLTFQAFCSLLSVQRFFGVAENETIEALLVESTQDQQEVTGQLGIQVRRAVEVLIQSLDRNDYDSGRTLLEGIDERQLYNAALTVMMRLVFLFCAEERGLLLLGHALYDQHYAVSTLRDQLREMADQHGEEVLEYRFDAWARLLATSRAVYGGVEHVAMRLPPYGGDLFDPDRYPFLEGRKPGTSWRETPADPLTISNRTVLHLLEALQILQVRVPGGGIAEARRLSFRALDIEQIGHVYESLLDHTAVRAGDIVLGLAGSKDKEPEILLTDLEMLRAKSIDTLVKHLAEETGRAEKTLSRLLTEKQSSDEQRLFVSCGNNQQLFERVKPFSSLLRNDTSGYPVVIGKGSIYVTAGRERRSSGTYYTPRSLTEPIVKHTLEPLVYDGPNLGKAKEEWKLKSAKEILNLKICDMAMGSGAFLVQACRYLSERLVEAWEEVESQVPESVLITPEGELSTGSATDRIIPSDATERLAIARRYITDRCLYGVDKNPMAVEMAKLSLWLITLQRDRPFTFLNHALKCGDSLVGITDLDQLRTFSLVKEQGRQRLILQFLEDEVNQAIEKRNKLEQLPSIDYSQLIEKNELNNEAEEAIAKLRCAADMLIHAEMCQGTSAEKGSAKLDAQLKVVRHYHHETLDDFRKLVNTYMDAQCTFHWPLEFPEVFNQRGFDAIIGNPPFMKGHFISRNLGYKYREFLVSNIARENAGLADLVAFFFLRGTCILEENGILGLISTNSIADGDTNRIGLQLPSINGAQIIRASQDIRWPGTAGVVVSIVHLFRGDWFGDSYLDNNCVAKISNQLTIGNSMEPQKLISNQGKSFIGSYLLGDGFVIPEQTANNWISKDKLYSTILFPYINGKELYTYPDRVPRRWAINFWDWDENHAKQFIEAYTHILALVKPVRDKVNRERNRKNWWLHAENRPGLYISIGRGDAFEKATGKAIKPGEILDRVLVKAKTSNTWAFAFLPNNVLFDQSLAVFTFSKFSSFAIMQSSIHETWAHFFSSTLKTDMSYTPSLVFETYPFPITSDDITYCGEQYYINRQQVMMERQEGLTRIYNRFHNSKEQSADIKKLRELHSIMDRAVTLCYGWDDLNLDHNFHETKQGIRYTISQSASNEILARLMRLNHERYAQEVAQGLHDKNNEEVKSRKNNNNVNIFD